MLITLSVVSILSVVSALFCVTQCSHTSRYDRQGIQETLIEEAKITDKTDETEKPYKRDNTGKTDCPDDCKTEKDDIDKTDSMDRSENADTAEKPDVADKPVITDRADRDEEIDKTDTIDKNDKTDEPGKSRSLPSSSGGHIFVTVGTTQFNDLTRAVDTVLFHSVCVELGYERMVVQFGRGTCPLLGVSHESETGDKVLLSVKCVDYLSSVAYTACMKNSSLVVCHGGAGSILAACRTMAQRRGDKPSDICGVLVVPNTSLMDNHQTEMSVAMAKRGYLTLSPPPLTPASLSEGIREVTRVMRSSTPHSPYPSPDLAPFNRLVEELVGLNPFEATACDSPHSDDTSLASFTSFT
eukprot:GHVN01008725.1.p1 GENE.GHVN01008725.1~~GHVN01008725.1.p1  ORF type:complete len:355 (-),score=88.50 GHVN01008725.1:740-1804(-)